MTAAIIIDITHVAIRFRNKIYSLPAPARHCDVIKHIVETTGYTTISVDMHREQGFLDTNGLFLDRAAAYVRAQGNGQLTAKGHKEGVLFSEDLW